VRVLVSACLLGRACRFDGGNKRNSDLVRALEKDGVEIVAFCPEEAAGLGTPRVPVELHGGDGNAVLDGLARALTEEKVDATDAFIEGARMAVACARDSECRVAYLKERSPSCGCALVHGAEGVVAGSGVTAAALRRAGVATVSVD